jgi:hypothetical protein
MDKDSLIEEARGFKSVEDFIKSRTIKNATDKPS